MSVIVNRRREMGGVHSGDVDYSKQYLTFVALRDGTFKLSRNAVSYSLDNGETWTTLAAGTASPTVAAGEKIIWKGELTPTTNGIGTFSSTGEFDVEGNTMSLLYGDDFIGQTDLTGKDYAFYYLFDGNSSLIKAENMSLPATTLANHCYRYMFRNCSSLITAPNLPSTKAVTRCYNGMFYGCSSLTTAPDLPSTTAPEYCYSSMFNGCTNLTKAPELPATILSSYSYQYMFQNCTSLTTAPQISAITVSSHSCSNMFNGCTSLSIAPSVLSAKTLAYNCYHFMFYNCKSLETAPEILAETLASGCCQSMFHNCSSLKLIKAAFITTPSTSYTQNWVNGVSASGTFVKNSAAQWDSGVNGIPNGWTVQTASE